MNAWMEYGPFSLADATNANVNFWYKNYSQLSADYFGWYVSTNGIDYSGWQVSGDQSTWRNQVFDLATVCGKGLLGAATKQYVDASVSGPVYTGAFVDDIAISKNATSTPDLTPYQLGNWNDKIPIGTTQLYGTNAHSYTGSYSNNQTLYFNWASLNQGTAAAGGYRVHVVVTGTGGGAWDWDIPSGDAASTYRSLTLDQAVGPLAAGSQRRGREQREQ